jgi:hypothetical protein
MTNRSPRIAAMIAVCSLGMVACDSPTSLPTRPTAPGAASRSITVQSDLGTEIQTLIATGFPKGQATAIGAMWDKVLRDLAKEPKTTLKGKVVPGNSGRSSLAKVASYIKLKTGDALPPSGETQAHFAARLVLDMSLYVYGGPATTPPVLTTTSDVALELVQPGVTTTVVTPAKLAAVVFPSGAVAEPTVVVITPDPAYYPTDCTGPLDTQLCQYPLFYHFNVFPDVKLGTPAKVQVCHVDAGSYRRPLADHDRFLVAHEKPANPADYSAGSTFDGNIEVLAKAVMNVANCPANGGTTYNPPIALGQSPLDRLQRVAMGVVNGMVRAATSIFVPNDVYAIDIGGGGFAEFFSTFGIVDPQSIPDLAQSPTLYFAPTQTTLATGQPIPLRAWSVTNLGSGTSGAFTSQIIIATDTGLMSPLVTVSLAGAASLVPGANFPYPEMSISIPPAPGEYWIGTKIIHAGPDSTLADDWTSFKFVVNDTGYVAPVPASCAAIHTTNSLLADGDYTIQSAGHNFTVYCAGMASSPKEYLTLAVTGPGKNFGSWAGEYTQPVNQRLLTTSYTRVRINPWSLKVATGDVTFASSTAPVFGPGHLLYSYNFASAGDCLADGSQQGQANVDLTGTPFRMNDSFFVDGWNPAGTINGVPGGTVVVHSQIVTLTGGGFCGGTTPVHADSLQLEFMTSLTSGYSINPAQK